MCGVRMLDQDQVAARNLQLWFEIDNQVVTWATIQPQRLEGGELFSAFCARPGTHVVRAKWLDPSTSQFSEWSNQIEVTTPTVVPELSSSLGLFVGILFFAFCAKRFGRRCGSTRPARHDAAGVSRRVGYFGGVLFCNSRKCFRRDI